MDFLFTRVHLSTEQDWDKLRRAIQYLNMNQRDHLTPGASNLDNLLTFIDVSFGCHPDMKSQTGGGVSFGRGFFITPSTEQKMDTGSTKEPEIVGATDYLPKTVSRANEVSGA